MPTLERRVWLATRGSQAVAGSIPSLAEAPAWGLGGVIAMENPGLRVVRIDLDPAERDDEAGLLVATLEAGDGETRVAFRKGQRRVARLTPGTVSATEAEAQRCLEIEERGVLDHLALRPAPRVAPGPGELEIRVVATGLNFRDVLNALGMYPGDPGPLGNECAGVVTAVGDGVQEFAPGDEVVTMIDRSFATYVVSPAALTVRKPSNLTFAEAATIPVTFLTADYALTELGRIKAGDRVLIHAATGGVGMAALQLARRAGAEIFATASTPAKRALARALGAHHVGDSRSTTFVKEFERPSDDAGIDIVLNSLAGEFIPASLGLLRSGGRFIEIGKTDIWDAAAVANAFPDVEYHPLYLGEVTAAQPLMMRARLQRVMEDLSTGTLTPLPQTVYPIEQAQEAFRLMAQGRHTGKIVITQRYVPEVRADATYLITGGLGGLGLACARGLAESGARHLVLLARRAPSVEARSAIEALEKAGVSVTVAQTDIAISADVAALFERIRTTLPPLRGVLHAAGVVDDGLLAEQNLERFERVMAPKVQGTWHLHTQTRGLPLDFFVMFSSGAALLGSPGQSNYAAANSFMDALAVVRRADGRHALSIAWGSWSDVGMAAEVSEQHRRRWAEQGLRMISPADGVRMLDAARRGCHAAHMTIMPLNRKRLPRALGPFFQRILDVGPATRPREIASADVLRQITQASPESRAALVTAFLMDQLMRVLAVDRNTTLRTDQSLMEMGLDSLMAMELRNRVQSAVKVRLSVADLLAGPTADELALEDSGGDGSRSDRGAPHAARPCRGDGGRLAVTSSPAGAALVGPPAGNRPLAIVLMTGFVASWAILEAVVGARLRQSVRSDADRMVPLRGALDHRLRDLGMAAAVTYLEHEAPDIPDRPLAPHAGDARFLCAGVGRWNAREYGVERHVARAGDDPGECPSAARRSSDSTHGACGGRRLPGGAVGPRSREGRADRRNRLRSL